MAEQIRRHIERECGALNFSADVELSRHYETRTTILDWIP